MSPRLQSPAVPSPKDPVACDCKPASLRWLPAVWRCARLVLIAYLFVVLLLMFFEESLIFFPTRFPEGDWTPPGLAFQDAEFKAADGTRLHGWYVEHEAPCAVILFCHGNGANITNRAGVLQILHDRVGASVLIFDYRGYGRSDGKPDEPGVLADARAARAWLAQREGIAETEVVLLGRSLGGAVAVDLAAADGARGLIVESTFSSIPDMAADIYPWLPVRWLVRTRLEVAGKIGDYHGPLLQSHGEDDTIVPCEQGRRVFAAANEPKEFIPLPGHGHNEPLPLSYYDKLAEFLRGLPVAPE